MQNIKQQQQLLIDIENKTKYSQKKGFTKKCYEPNKPLTSYCEPLRVTFILL